MQKIVHSPGLALTFGKEEIDTARREGKLLSLDIAVTGLCNLHCIYCYADASGKKDDKELSLTEVYRAIDEAIDLGIKTLNITGGEPLLHENYFDIAKYAHKRGISVLLFTNGTLIDEKVAEKLMDLRISPCVKLDSLVPEIQDYLAGSKESLNRIRNGINRLIDVGYTDKYPVLSVNAVICRQNLDEIPRLWIWARRQNLIPSVTRLQAMGRAKERFDLTVTSMELYRLFHQLSEIDRALGIEWQPDIPWIYGKSCKRQYIGCFIDRHGNVQPCSGVPIKAGNIRDQSLTDILSGSEIFNVARNIDKYTEGACGSCTHKGECYGCRSIAYFEDCSFTAADPLCWHNHNAH